METRFESIRYEFSTSNWVGITLHKFSNFLRLCPMTERIRNPGALFCVCLVEPSSALVHREEGPPPKIFFRTCTPYPVAS